MAERKKVLISDEEHIVRLVSSALGRAGCRVIAVTHGEVAERARANAVDLILFGVPLRPLDTPGCEIVRAIRSDPMLAGVPLIVMTGKTASPADMPWCIELPAIDFITKPFAPAELLTLINRRIPGFDLPIPRGFVLPIARRPWWRFWRR